MIKWFKAKNKENTRLLAELPEVDLSEWVDAGQAVELGKLMRNPTMRLAVRIVAESVPIPMPASGSPESDIIFAAGMTAGYSLCLDNLRKLSDTASYKEPVATFENPKE